MSTSYGLTKENILSTFPSMLAKDTNLAKLASITADILVTRYGETNLANIYSRIGQLDETLLDILAYDFKVDWWYGGLSLEEKRNTLLQAWSTHSKLGTKKIIEETLSAIYEGTQVVEWFDYEAQPFHFKILIDIAYQNVDATKYNQIISKIGFYKNLRSVLDAIEFVEMGASATFYPTCGFCSQAIIDGGTAT